MRNRGALALVGVALVVVVASCTHQPADCFAGCPCIVVEHCREVGCHLVQVQRPDGGIVSVCSDVPAGGGGAGGGETDGGGDAPEGG